MIKFETKLDCLVLVYKPDNQSIHWIIEKFQEDESFTLKNTFTLNKNDLYSKKMNDLNDEDEVIRFQIGILKNGYFKISNKILNTKNHFYLQKTLKINRAYFIAIKNISIFKKIDKVIANDFYVGGFNKNFVPIEVFENLIKSFPNQYEIDKYAKARITSVVADYIETIRDEEKSYNSYMNKKTKSNSSNLLKIFKLQDTLKLRTILTRIEIMLKNEINYSENQWQTQILQIVILLFPKYISVLKEVSFKDIYSGKSRRLDFVLVDSSGHLDIIEIKKPFDKPIMSKNQYRDNYIPTRELSGTIMQIEKYIYYLNKTGIQGEQNLSKKFKSALPKELGIRITNPRGIIILGRRNNLSPDQIYDFEIVKRKYKNILDIFTYDDIVDRIKMAISQIEKL